MTSFDNENPVFSAAAPAQEAESPNKPEETVEAHTTVEEGAVSHEPTPVAVAPVKVRRPTARAGESSAAAAPAPRARPCGGN